MDAYFEALRDRILRNFNWESQRDGRTTRSVRVQLCSGDWLDGGLVTHGDATFTIETQRDRYGQSDRRHEIPYMSVASIETVFDRE